MGGFRTFVGGFIDAVLVILATILITDGVMRDDWRVLFLGAGGLVVVIGTWLSDALAPFPDEEPDGDQAHLEGNRNRETAPGSYDAVEESD